MEKKPTHEAWEQRVKKLEKEIIKLKLERNELTSLQEQLKILFEFAPDGYFLHDLAGKFMDGNKNAEALTGYTREELMGKNLLILLSPKQIKKAAMVVAKNVKGHPILPEEFSLNRKDGSHVEVEIRSFPIKIKGKTVILGIARDISKRKRNAKLLEESEKKYRTLFESSRDAIMLINEKRKILHANTALKKMFGFVDNEEFSSLHVIDLSPEYQPDGILSLVKSEQLIKITQEKGTYFCEWKCKRKDGKEFFSTLLLTKMELDNEIILQATVRDITESKLIEEALKQFKTMADKQTIGNAIADIKGNLTYCNEAFATMHGYNNKELIGKNLSFFNSEEPTGKTSKIKNLKEWLVKKDGYHNEEVWHVKKDGSVFPALMNVTVIKDERGVPLFFATSMIDISIRKNAEEALKKREKELEIKTSSLEKTNTALGVLLQKREEDKKRLEEGVLFNMRRTVEPYLEKLKDSILDERQKLYVSILEKNLKDIISTFPQALSSQYIKLTPAELEVANLVKQGKSTKEIALALNISHRTAEVHRNNIRKKINLKNRKDNLRTHLLSSIPG